MKLKFLFAYLGIGVFLCLNCSTHSELKDNETSNIVVGEPPKPDPNNTLEIDGPIKILSLGDSYTIGESVCEACRFPEQLKAALMSSFNSETTVDLKVVAQTGWTTTNLLTALTLEDLKNDYNLVTLLIGVNNQYQNRAFSIYETEFPKLVNQSILYAKGNKLDVIVISIPDYAFTPFGQNIASTGDISAEIDAYNNYAKSYCDANGMTFVNITDITRNGLINKALVASDNLHPSELAYSKFVDKLLPIAKEKLQETN